MKVFKLALVAVLFSSVMVAQKKVATKEVRKVEVVEVSTPLEQNATSQMKWASDVHDFGDIAKDKPVSYDFTFTNTTKETIIISAVKPSCGCTATNYTKTPIKPGEKGLVTATYNAAAANNFNRTITVTTNETNSAPKVLTIKGNVVVPTTQSVESRS